MPAWTPKQAGSDYTSTPTLVPLEPLRRDVTLLTGLAQEEGFAKGDGAGDHARSAATFLTGTHPVKTSGADIRAGVSVDQVAAQQVGHLTRLPSLELGIEQGRQAGNCDSGYSCAYSSNISWKTPSLPMAKETNPRLVFERLFGTKDDRTQQARRVVHRKSVLDYVAQDAARLEKQLGKTDRRKLDEYFTSLRDIERRITRIEKPTSPNRPDFKLPDGVPKDLAEHLRLMYDLIVLVFQTDTTRIVTLMVGNAGSNRSYPMVGVHSGWHQLSHHRNDQQKIDQLGAIDKFHVTQLARFLGKLKATDESNTNLLGQSMVLYGSGLSDGNRHRHDNLPIVLAGNGGGTIQAGRHIRYDHAVPLNNLFLSMLDRVGADVPSLGDSTGRLSELTG